MTLQHAQSIVGHGDGLELYEGYSGRGMYGVTTVGVTGSQSEIIEAIALASAAEGPDFAGRMRSLQWDSMGKQAIAY